MAKLQKLAHYAGILILLVWGGVLIYFYLSGRIVHYLTSNATFREQALIAGLVLVVLALFNLLTGAAEVGEHQHGHSHDDDEGHDTHDGHHHAHAGGEHEHAHDHGHEHGHEHEHDHNCGCGHGEHAHHGHDHESTFVGGPVAALVLLVPILLSAFLTPDAYSARAVRNKLALTTYGAEAPRGIPTLGSKIAAASSAGGAVAEDAGSGARDAARGEGGAAPQAANPTYGEFTQADLDRMVDKSPEGNYMLEIIELFYTAGDTEIQRVLEGLPMEAIGQVLADTGKRDPGASERLRIFRLYVECCAADARPLSIPVEFTGGLPEFREMGWYKVTGAVTYRQENGVTVPVIQGQSLTQVEPPEERMSF